jgi:septal ring factor EnvC (AmiA/AmiB activator)
MKLHTTFNKLPLLALLSLGLACSPLVVSADDSDHDRHDRHDQQQQDYNKPHHRVDHHKDHRDNQNDRRHDKRVDYSKHKKSLPEKSHGIYHWRSNKVQPYLIRHHRNVVMARPFGQWCL